VQKLLIVDDNADIRKQLRWGLIKDYKIILAATADEALKLFREHEPKVVTLDLGLPPDEDGASEGLRVMQEILSLHNDTKVIVVSGNEDRDNALKAVDLGAYDFYQKPIDLNVLKIILSRAFHLSTLEADNRRLQSRLAGQPSEMAGIFGQCPEILGVFNTIRKVATTDVPVLILGESGTGKEMVARALHEKSLHKNGPFVPINCGAIPENLLESELFGHEKGAFTGAMARVQGKVEFADGGTLFLDEIGEMPVSLQVKLLRFLQEQVIQRVGGREDIQVNARIVAATNIDINKAIQEGRFREDLFYRIGVINLELPPLRDRGEDISLLAHLFLQRYSDSFNRRVRGFSRVALEQLMQYEWPGNVRELENRVKRAVVMAESAMVEEGDLGFEVSKDSVAGDAVQTSSTPVSKANVWDIDGLTLKEARDKLDQQLVMQALELHDGNVAKAAEQLGVSRPTFYDLMRKFGLHS